MGVNNLPQVDTQQRGARNPTCNHWVTSQHSSHFTWSYHYWKQTQC